MSTCLRCGAPLDPDDTVCFNCGAPAGETKTPTQPVPLPKAAREHTRTMRALRPHAAATSTSDGSDQTPHDASPPADRFAPVLSRPLPPLSAPFASGRATTRTRRGKRGRWLLVLVVVVVLAGLGAGGGIVLRAMLAGPPIPTSVLYHDPSGRFSAREPALWVARSQPSGAIFADSANVSAVTSTIQVSITAAPANASAAGQADALATSLALANPTHATRTFASQTWEERQGTTVGSDGATREVLLEVTIVHGQVYAITCESPVASFSGTNTLVFQPFFASFTIG